MIKKFIIKCLEEAKEDYFNDDHHYYNCQEAKEMEWERIFDEDIFYEYVLDKIETNSPDLYRLSTPHNLYVYCLELMKGK